MLPKFLFISPVPSFYKNLLLHTLSPSANVHVYFTNRSAIRREKDFYRYLDQQQVLELPTGFFRSLVSLWNICRKQDRIYYGGWDDRLYLMLALLCSKKKNRVIVESSIYEYDAGSFRKKILNRIKTMYLRRISCCIVSGTPHGQLVKKLGFKGEIRYSYGVGLLDFNYASIDRSGQSKEAIKEFLFIGRVNRQKGIDILIEFFQNRPDLNLHIVGGNDENIPFGNDGNIFYHGYKTRDDLRDVFAQADVFILPSRVEPWGLVIEEALYHGIPVITSNKVGCHLDIVDHYNVGLVFDIDSATDMAEKIAEITVMKNYQMFQANIAEIDFKKRSESYRNAFLS